MSCAAARIRRAAEEERHSARRNDLTDTAVGLVIKTDTFPRD
ncbi:hypothetical protein [Streptomyces beihaiensis]|uniref:Uncharacterized protein n=1 Tax=Streptomyces beihaiensis TaxID=2984495 RepID=A0ABT3U2S9_9ACTN|nr:hypothetical protein [Streptomyces beihaiensis]MCX3063619.1 hypothetical protein [Streptomyces beihaiensis]